MLTNTKNRTRDKLIDHAIAGVRLTALTIMLGSLSMTAIAAPDSANREIDPNAPIAALEVLNSLKEVKPLVFNLPKIQYFTTRNGVPVSFVRTSELPILDIDITFNAGSARDDAIRKGGFGISNMTATMLKNGTTSLEEDAFNQQVEQLGLWLSTEAFKDMFKVTLRTLSDDKYLVPATKLLADMLANPRFDEGVLERRKAQVLSELQQNSQYPGYVAQVAFTQALFGDHPYGHLSMGSEDTVPSITRTDLLKFQQQFLVADNARLTMTGDLTLNQAQGIANQITADLPRGQKAAPLPTPAPITATQRIDIPFDSSQTTVKIGQLGFKRSTDPIVTQQQESFTIGDEVIGGSGFGSRLMKEVRKNKGYTYGIYSNMANMQTNGPYVIGFAARQDVVEDAINTTIEIVEDTLDNGITEKEYNLTKENLINSYPKKFASNANINSMVANSSFYGLSDDYLNGYFDRINGATLSDVNAALNETINPDKLITVTVGKQD